MEEKIEKEEVEKEETDRRDFLKTAVKVAGALAAVSAIGNLVEDSSAQVKATEKVGTAALGGQGGGLKIAGAEAKFLKTANKKQFGLEGVEIGKVLQAEGFIPGTVRDLGKASLHVSVSW